MSHITAAANIMGKLYHYPIIVFKMRNMRADAVIIATISVHCHRKYRFDEFALSIMALCMHTPYSQDGNWQRDCLPLFAEQTTNSRLFYIIDSVR